jgi:hypothetical protein
MDNLHECKYCGKVQLIQNSHKCAEMLRKVETMDYFTSNFILEYTKYSRSNYLAAGIKLL